MSGFEVREAASEDFEAVATLLAELGRPAVMGGQDEAGHRDRYLRYLEDPNLHVFVAEEDGEVVGMIDLELLPRLNFTTPMAWVPDLIVTEARRSDGVGAALLARAEEAARLAGAWALTLESANWRARTRSTSARGWTTPPTRSRRSCARTWGGRRRRSRPVGSSPGSSTGSASVRLHQRFGFRRVAFSTEQGRKFGRYWDVAWYQKDL